MERERERDKQSKAVRGRGGRGIKLVCAMMPLSSEMADKLTNNFKTTNGNTLNTNCVGEGATLSKYPVLEKHLLMFINVFIFNQH